MTKVIGVSLGYNTSAAVIDTINGVELAISEERLNGEKNTKKFPINALKRCIEYLNLPKNATDPIYIGISSYEVINERTMQYITDNPDVNTFKDDIFSYLEEYIRVECNIPEEVLIAFNRVEHHE